MIQARPAWCVRRGIVHSIKARGSRLWLCALLVCLAAGCGRLGASGFGTATGSEQSGETALQVPRFVDGARQAGVQFVHHNGHHGPYYYPEMIGGGCGLIDADGDGWLDLFLVQGAPLPTCRVKGQEEQFSDRLYHNNHDGTFTDITRRAGVSGIVAGRKAYSIGCAAGDYDNDGHDDLLVTTYGRPLLYHNNGDGTFTDVAARAGLARDGFWTSAAFFDADNDGYLDLVICQYIRYQPGDDIACGTSRTHRDYCPPGFFPPSRSALYHNQRNGTFRDITESAGLVSPYNKALGVVTADLDDDGAEDIFIACDLTPNLLYVNQLLGSGETARLSEPADFTRRPVSASGSAGTRSRLAFREEAVARGVAFDEAGQSQASMGVDWRDYDGDLRPDLLVTNYWSESTGLFRNRENGFFSDESESAGLGASTLRRVGWGTALRDFDNDGHLDLFSHNGHVMLRPEQATPGASARQRDQLFLQRGGGRFEEVSDRAGPWFRAAHMGRGAAFGDLDNNGTVDILAVQINEPAALLLNGGSWGRPAAKLFSGRHWLELKLVGTRSNRDAIGARVCITAGGVTHCDEVRSAYSYASANDLRLHFGLGAASHADRIQIRWPSGRQQERVNIAADQIVRIVEGQ